jgi:structural maintenance of chromosome 2
MRAMTMLDKAEVQYNDLMRKKATVETDKAKIKKVIQELDRKKKEELRTAWEKVNKDFGSIFATLLPGSRAKLQPPDGLDVLDGLEVKVAFGDVWKESLSELSGGQRSLVALSLILSLLLFKPAPLYILDEVDAALDLSHTQNIGHMLKTHFKHSQVEKTIYSLSCCNVSLTFLSFRTFSSSWSRSRTVCLTTPTCSTGPSLSTGCPLFQEPSTK